MKQERKIINIDVGNMSESEVRHLLDTTQSEFGISDAIPDRKSTFYDKCKRFIRLYIFGKE